MKLRRDVAVEEAPRAIPSAVAWMTRPRVVEDVCLPLSWEGATGVGGSGTDDVRVRVRLNWLRLI